jgi:hypothetical protein
VVVTLSIGPQGREEDNSTLATQTSLVFCRELDPFVYRDSLRLRANCKLEDFYVRAALRSVTLDDEAACERADRDGILLVDPSEMQPGNRVIADASSAAWKMGDCGSQYESFDLVVE